MVKDENLKFDTVETKKLEDLSHLWVTEGNMVRMISQEEYDKREAAKKEKEKEEL